jgi:hypothetical protein
MPAAAAGEDAPLGLREVGPRLARRVRAALERARRGTGAGAWARGARAFTHAGGEFPQRRLAGALRPLVS